MDKETAEEILRANKARYCDSPTETREALDTVMGDGDDPGDALRTWSLFYEGMPNTYEARMSRRCDDPDELDAGLRVIELYCDDTTDDNEAFMDELFCSPRLKCVRQMEFMFELFDDKEPYAGLSDGEIKELISEFASRHSTQIVWGEDLEDWEEL